MTDKDKLLKMHKDLQYFEIPKDFDDKEMQVIVNTIESGIEMMKSWLVEEAKKKFTK